MSSLPAISDTSTADLMALVAHRHSVPAETLVDGLQEEFARLDVDFLAVLDGGRLRGVCARRELAQALGSRFGFALNARRPVLEHLMATPLRAVDGSPLTEVFKSAAARNEREFYDDVLLVDTGGNYLGMIPMHTLVRLQTEILLGNIARIEASRREIKEKNQQMEADLHMAREVQLALLPQQSLTLSSHGRSLRIGHRYQPAGGVSGDFFDVLQLSDHAAGIFICDVMGHGVRSALVTAMVRAMIEELRPVANDPGLLLTHLNRDLTRILRQSGGLIFVTAAYAVIHLGDSTLRYAQAGHPTPLRVEKESTKARPLVCPPDQAGPALGLLDDFVFTTGTELFGPGDRVVLFTDGLVEAASAAGEEFGESRLAAAISRLANNPLEEALDGLKDEVAAFAGGSVFTDDVCVVAADVVPLEQTSAEFPSFAIQLGQQLAVEARVSPGSVP